MNTQSGNKVSSFAFRVSRSPAAAVGESLETRNSKLESKVPKAKKEFAAAMEQAMQRRPAKQQETGQVEKGESESALLPPAHVPTGSPDGAKVEESGEVASPEVAAPAEGSSETAASAEAAPQNIVPFPVPSVIIPFPLEEAKALSSAHLPTSPPANASGQENGESESEKVGKWESKRATSTEGVDVAKLGLSLVEDGELPENVHPVRFSKPERTTASSESTIIEVSFQPDAKPETGREESTRALSSGLAPRALRPAPEPVLPGASGTAEDSALETSLLESVVEPQPQVQNPAKGVVHAGSSAPPPRSGASPEATGISVARQKGRMESLSNSEPGSAPSGGVVPASGAMAESSAGAMSPERGPGDVLDFSARNLNAMDWQAGRPVSSSDRPAAETINGHADGAATVERISRLVLSEVALVRQHSSDSMAVVLRPDADTELFVHLAQRNGQVEATVRCERGDAQLLGALWGQLQESLAQQKVRLAPLQESPSNQSHFNQSSGSDTSGHGQGSPRQSPSEKQSMDEWPVPAPADSAHVRGRSGSRHRRLTTSRPGWETWA